MNSYKWLNQRLVKLCQILLPLHGEQLLFGRVAFLAAGYHVAPGAFSAPGYRHNVIHGQFFRRCWAAAVMANTFGETAFPPLGFSKFPCFVTRPFQIFFAQIIGKWLDGFLSFHFCYGRIQAQKAQKSNFRFVNSMCYSEQKSKSRLFTNPSFLASLTI